MRSSSPLRSLLAPVLLALLAGCSNQELYGQLSERQANEMVAVLQSAGIEAEKKTQDGKFAVLTASRHFPQAVRALSAQGYPRESYDTMGKVFKKEGFVSSPLEERARLLHALSQEISNTISSIDGVVTARVHLVVPEKHPLVDKVQPAAAAVFIKHRPDRDLSGQVTQIKALVVNSIEGLAYENVTVALFPAESVPANEMPRKPGELPADRQLTVGAPMMLGGVGGSFALAGGGLLWWRRRVPSASTPTPALPAPTPRALTTNDFEAALQRGAAKAR